MEPETLSVVIIGPMSDAAPAPGEVPVSQHLPNIARALSAASENLVEEGARVRLIPVSANDFQVGDISDFAMLSIDQADLAIADISMSSPNVMYELAMLHALGTPTILIDYSENLADPPFYLKKLKVVGVDDFSIDNLVPALTEALKAPLVHHELDALRTNPISKFYGNHLVDASAATGLATGYFYNFARWVIEDNRGLLAELSRRNMPGTRDITHLAVIKPTSFYSIDDDLRIIENLPGYYRGRTYEASGFARKFTFNTVGPYIVDWPTPIQSLNASPSYIKIKRLLTEYPVRGFAIVEKYEQRMIDAYLRAIHQMADATVGMNPSRLRFISAEELADEIGAPGEV